jgi:tRNA pseudouridine55 synthase
MAAWQNRRIDNILPFCNFMDGLLVVDKPAGLTSHDVVARVRRILRERSVGHTGTLDPAATGVLPLVLGRATRLARFLSASDKTYEAIITLGLATDTADASGAAVGGSYAGPLPSRDAIDRALDGFRGTFLQEPPAYSAKKIGGTRSYKLARASSAASRPLRPSVEAHLRPSVDLPPSPVRPQSVPVVVHRLDLLDVSGDRVTLRVDCAAGFYVRSLAHELGTRLGTGAHLTGLRRTRHGECSLADAISLDTAEREPDRTARHVVPLAQMLRDFPSVVLTAEGVRRAAHGQDLGPGDTDNQTGFGIRDSGFVRLLDPVGDLVGIAKPAAVPGLLHPSVVLV